MVAIALGIQWQCQVLQGLADARAVAYLELRIGDTGEGGQTRFGVGIDTNIVSASLKAIASALNRARGVSFTSARDATLA